MLNARGILEALESCFEPDELETLVAQQGAAVKLSHRPSGRAFVEDDHPTQIQNKIAALLRLLREEVPRMS